MLGYGTVENYENNCFVRLPIVKLKSYSSMEVYKQQLLSFINDDTADMLEFPASLSKKCRKQLHVFAYNHGLKSHSVGCDSERRLIVEKIVKTSTSTLQMQPQTWQLIDNFINATSVQHLQTNGGGASSQLRAKAAQPALDRFSGVLGLLPRIPTEKCSEKLLAARMQLPVWQHKQQIIDAIHSNRVVIICGETGSGKTTQVPQYILEDCAQRKTPCQIIVAQPRRIAAVSIAERVAYERGEPFPGTVGYKIRLESRHKPTTILTFCTNGVLLRSFKGGNFARRINTTHIIIDEVHERDRYSDFLLICLKKLLTENRANLKIILMSATMDPKLFHDYFKPLPTKVLQFAGRVYPVKEYFLEDVLRITDYKNNIMMNIEKNDPKTNVVPVDIELESLSTPTDSDDETDDFVDETLAGCVSGDENSFEQLYHMIMSEGLNINACHSQTGITGLMAAAASANEVYVKTFLKLGAKRNMVSKDGRTAEQYVDAKNDHILSLFKSVATKRADSIDAQSHDDNETFELDEDKMDLDRLHCYQSTVDSFNVDYLLALELIVHCHWADVPGSILFFLPGVEEIMIMESHINQEPRLDPDSIVVFSLHGSMDPSDQRQVFKSFPGRRKIVLSTNIAETSITIDDVVYVIDCGKVKEKSFDSTTQFSSLKSICISKACAKQRAGRAGRTGSGVCFHLFSWHEHTTMQTYSTPEILRLPLHELCLHSKMIAPDTMSIDQFLGLLIEPPSPISIRAAIDSLKTIGALTNDEQLTPLGELLAVLPIEPHFGKALIYGIVLKCLDPILTIVSSLSHREPFIRKYRGVKQPHEVARNEHAKDTFSDHMVLLNVFRAWKITRNKRAFCMDNCISYKLMEMIDGTRKQLYQELKNCGLVDSAERFETPHFGGAQTWTKITRQKQTERNSKNVAVITGALVAGLYPNIAFKAKKNKFTHVREAKVPLCKYSVANETMKTSRFSWFVFNELVKMGESQRQRFIMGVTPVSALAVFLLAGSMELDRLDNEQQNNNSVAIINWMPFSVAPHQTVKLLLLRQMLHAYAMRQINDPYRDATQLENQLLQVIAQALQNEFDSNKS